MSKEITKDDFVDSEEIWTSIFRCPHCKEECVQQNDNFCSCCGKEVTWNDNTIEFFA